MMRWTDYSFTALPGWRLSMNGNWTVPAQEFAPDNPEGTTIVLGDDGKVKLAEEIRRLMGKRQRVVAIDPFYFGESRIEARTYLYALLISSLGERQLGVQSGEVAAVAR